MELIALAFAFTAALVALALTPLVRAVALRVGFVDQPGERKIHTAPVAYGGGIAVALALTVVLAAGVPIVRAHLSSIHPQKPLPLPPPAGGKGSQKPVLAEGPGFPETGKELRGWVLVTVAAGACGALLLGLLDDKYRLSPWTKLAVQFVLAGAAVAGGVRITAFIGDNWLMRAVTVLWIVLITNSFNLLDNMDGLCAGAAAIAGGILSFLALENGQWRLALALAALAGACLGFLKYNRAPATIFLGDAGSLCVGYLMACFTALVTYYHRDQPSRMAIGIPLLILAIPLYDTFSVILIRLRERRPIRLAQGRDGG